MSTTTEQMRAWRGPALFTYGFRPFFFGAALWASLAMVLWIAMITGQIVLPSAFDPISWHAHEFLFGYLGAVMAGFLLTAVPNWTGRLPIVGWPLAGLFALWVAGRIAVAASQWLSPLAVALVDLALPVALSLAIAREIVAGRNWRNLGVLALLGLFGLGNAMFHCEAARHEFAAQGEGLRLGVGAAIMLIALIGGRIVPSFTRNWLMRNAPGRMPSLPEMPFDKVALIVLLIGVIGWIVAPAHNATALLLGLAGILHIVRLGRWAGDRTLAEPLVWVLHLGYAFVPLGALALAMAQFVPVIGVNATGQHLWMAGAIGMMTLAVMTRATRGHTGRELAADRMTTALYLALLCAVLLRAASGFAPEHGTALHALAGLAWIAAFGGFCLGYGRMLLLRRAG
ncbi:MAG: NnrS family protein [Sphingomonadales bacterium]|nr:NnrS family protein [Sphingomonadales bacterium]